MNPKDGWWLVKTEERWPVCWEINRCWRRRHGGWMMMCREELALGDRELRHSLISRTDRISYEETQPDHNDEEDQVRHIVLSGATTSAPSPPSEISSSPQSSHPRGDGTIACSQTKDCWQWRIPWKVSCWIVYVLILGWLGAPERAADAQQEEKYASITSRLQWRLAETHENFKAAVLVAQSPHKIAHSDWCVWCLELENRYRSISLDWHLQMFDLREGHLDAHHLLRTIRRSQLTGYLRPGARV